MSRSNILIGMVFLTFCFTLIPIIVTGESFEHKIRYYPCPIRLKYISPLSSSSQTVRSWTHLKTLLEESGIESKADLEQLEKLSAIFQKIKLKISGE